MKTKVKISMRSSGLEFTGNIWFDRTAYDSGLVVHVNKCQDDGIPDNNSIARPSDSQI